MKFYPRNAGVVLKPWHDKWKLQEIFESPQMIGLIETLWLSFPLTEQTCNGFRIDDPFALRGLYRLPTCDAGE